MRKNMRNEALKQGVQPAAQALGDDDLMDVSGGEVFWRWQSGTSGLYKEYGALINGRMKWYGEDARRAEKLAIYDGQSARLVEVD